MTTIEDVKKALNITGDFQNDAIQIYFDEVISFLNEAGVKNENITAGIVARGVSDLWNYGAGEGELSDYFMKRCKQLSLK